MKISNETKIGALAAVSIALLILGFNYLKGKTLFESSDRLYAIFDKVEGLAKSNPVTINGLQVGKVTQKQNIKIVIMKRSPNPTVQRTGASRLAQSEQKSPSRLALDAGHIS